MMTRDERSLLAVVAVAIAELIGKGEAKEAILGLVRKVDAAAMAKDPQP